MSKRILALALLVVGGCSSSRAARKPTTPTESTAASDSASPAQAANKPASATAAKANAPKKSLYERLGGQPAIDAVVGEFVSRVAQDERVNFTFGPTDLETLHKHLSEFFCVATGGPCQYTGRDMKSVHAGMSITSAQFNAIVENLVGSLDKFHVPEQEKSEILTALGPLKKDIVEVE